MEEQTNIRKPEVLPALTGVRAVAAGWVVMYHLIPQFETLFYGDSVYIYKLIASTGYLGVDLFFMLSGFILSLNYAERFLKTGITSNNYFKFMLARFSRIYPVHLFCIIILLLAVMIMQILRFPLDEQRFSIIALIKNLLLIHAWEPNATQNLTWNTPSWTISTEWLAYLFFPFLIVASERFIKAVNPLAVLLLLSCVPMAIYLFDKNVNPGSMNQYCRIIFEFVSGILMFKLYKTQFGNRFHWNRIITASLVIIFCLSALSLALHIEDHAYFIVPLLGVFLYGIIYKNSWYSNILSRPFFVYWGVVSYSVYMFHNIWIMLLKFALPAERFSDSNFLIKVGVILAYSIPIFVASALIFRFVEEPARNLINRKFRSGHLQA